VAAALDLSDAIEALVANEFRRRAFRSHRGEWLALAAAHFTDIRVIGYPVSGVM
jgi:hypothetical protein